MRSLQYQLIVLLRSLAGVITATNGVSSDHTARNLLLRTGSDAASLYFLNTNIFDISDGRRRTFFLCWAVNQVQVTHVHVRNFQ